MLQFKEVSLAGEPRIRGQIHGERLAREIRLSLEYYRSIFNLPDSRVLALGEYFYGLISAYNHDYAQEITGIAEGAGVDPLWVAALNARTEILSHGGINTAAECTALYYRPTALLGQNWDWAEPLEQLVVVIKIEFPDGHIIRMLTEPGIIGKIGLNSVGLGVCLNILTINRPLNGLPVHIILRSILECRSLEQARKVVESESAGKASNILAGDACGNYFDVEFTDQSPVFLDHTARVMLHTNHYLHQPVNSPDDPLFASSYARIATANAKIASLNEFSQESMSEILSDNSNRDFPILRPYQPDQHLDSLGTVCSIILDLKSRNLHIRKGNRQVSEFSTYAAI